MRPNISFYNNPVDMEEEIDEEGEEEAKPQAKSKSKGLTEVRIEYSKRRADENHFGPLTFAEVDSARNEEPWIVSSFKRVLHVDERSSGEGSSVFI